MQILAKIQKPTLHRISGPDLILAAGTVFLVGTMLFLLGVPGFRFLREKTHLVTINSHAATMQLAAESYAAQNRGYYPEDPFDLIPFLPGAKPPVNPYLGTAMIYKGAAGDLTYRSPTGGQDYIIQAWGPATDGQPVLLHTLTSLNKNNPIFF